MRICLWFSLNQIQNQEMSQQHKSTARVFLVVANSALGCFYFGYALGYLNPSQNTIEEQFKLGDYGKTSTIIGLITALLSAGAALGAFISGPLLSKCRRRNALIITDVIGLAGTLLGEIPNFYSLVATRLVIGVAVGLNSTLVPLYIKEYTPLSLRGTAGSMNQVTTNFGIFVAFLVGLGYPDCTKDPNCLDNSYWRIEFIVPAFAPILRTLVLLTIFKDDPPGYYVSLGDRDKGKAVQVLGDIYFEDKIQEQLSTLEREERQKALSSTRYADLLTPLYKGRLIIGCLLCMLQQFCGINAVIFYSTSIFQTINDNTQFVNILNIAVGLTNISFALLAGLLMRTFGRKQLLFFGNLLCFLCLVLLVWFSKVLDTNKDSTAYQYLTVGFLFLYLIGFQLSLGPITWIYIAEILPEKGMSLAVLTNWTCVFIVTLVFPIISGQIWNCFAIFAGCCFLGLFFIQFFIKETRGKTAHSIDNMYSLAQGLLYDDGQKPSSNIQRKP